MITTSNMQSRLVFFGSEAWGVPSLRALHQAGYEIIGVVTRPDAPAGRKRVLTPTPVKSAALELGLEVLEPDRVKDIEPWLADHQPAIGVLIAYGKLVPQSVIDAFAHGILNLHPSALPKFRGPSPIEAALLAGAPLGDVSIIQLSAAMDAGDIAAQTRLKLPQAKTLSAQAAYAAVGEMAPPLLVETVGRALRNELELVVQHEADATFSPMITKTDSILDCTQSAKELDRKVRAYAGWPGTEIQADGQRLIITKAHVGDTEPFAASDSTGARPGTLFATTTNELALVTGRGELIIDRLIIPGKSETSGQAYLAGRTR